MTRGQKAAARQANKARMDAIFAENQKIVAAGKCPLCGTPLRRNLALAGWWQCDAYGEPSFRRPEHRELPKCSFQVFTA